VEVPCPLCQGRNAVLYVMAPSHYGPEKHQVTRCLECGMIYTNPQPTTYLDEVEHRGALDRHFRPEVLAAMQRQGRFLLQLLSSLTSGRRLLDFGCGAGGMVSAAVQEGWSVTGFDLNRGLAEAANRHWKFNAIKTGSLDQFYAEHAGQFDAIISYQVFEHIQTPVAAALEMVRLLKPGGVLLIDVPNVYQPQEWFSRGQTLDPTSHWCHFSTRTLSDLIKRVGLDEVYCSAAPSFCGLYYKLGLTKACYRLGALTKSILPPIGSGVCVIGRKASKP
jgi:2-polyprenyl-3-methyl-5-hydroxy-6-metoxy-1,4-benzoquinol methylase